MTRQPGRHSQRGHARRWDQPDRRHLTSTRQQLVDLTPEHRWPGPGQFPADAWSEAVAPDETVRDERDDDTDSFDVSALRAHWDPPSQPLRPWESTGPLPTLPPPRDTHPPRSFVVTFLLFGLPWLIVLLAALAVYVAVAPTT